MVTLVGGGKVVEGARAVFFFFVKKMGRIDGDYSTKSEGEWRTPLLFKWSQGKAKPMSLEDISKITANLMRRAKVPVKFTPQSLRSAASSAAIDDGASVDRVLAQGRWSSKHMFKKYYYRPTGR